MELPIGGAVVMLGHNSLNASQLKQSEFSIFITARLCNIRGDDTSRYDNNYLPSLLLSGGVVWRVKCSDVKLVCAVGSRNGIEDTKLIVLDFDDF